MNPRYAAAKLIACANALLLKAGLEADKAGSVAEVLVEGDLLGHTTHGLQLLPLYLDSIAKGGMARSGGPEVIADFPAAVTWDGRHLPGPWLTQQAVDLAIERARTLGTCTVAIRRSHHIACLQAYLKKATDQGLVILLMCTDPNFTMVAPHGGRQGVYSPNPLAAGWPTDGEPVLLDVSMSITAMGTVRRMHAENRTMPGPWLVDAEGKPTNDPAVCFNEPRGAMLPLGGLDHGHKGYALGLLIEALAGGLAGHGRADPAEGLASDVFVQVMDPALFGGKKDFLRQSSFIAEACRNSPPREGFDRVRLPGETGLRKRAAQLKDGVELYPGIMPALQPWLDKLGVPAPPPMNAT